MVQDPKELETDINHMDILSEVNNKEDTLDEEIHVFQSERLS